MMAAGAGGLMVGGLAGAALAGDSSDDGTYLRSKDVPVFTPRICTSAMDNLCCL